MFCAGLAFGGMLSDPSGAAFVAAFSEISLSEISLSKKSVSEI